MTREKKSLSPDLWDVVSSSFDELTELSTSGAKARLSELSLPPQASALLSSMLSANQEQNILDRSIDEVAEKLLQHPLVPTYEIPSELIGRRFGRWMITGELARGGMGAVFLAERTDGQFEKTVALKLIKPGIYTDYTAQRFSEEMQTLARLEHPNIARLIDGGISDEDLPYFVMEHVRGGSITHYADQQQLTLRARVELICQVCAAVEHAHQNLIVHGDLKPSNILVDEQGQVRVVDFGIARSLQSTEDQPTLPRFTPQYAAPEQAIGEPITTASDVFCLSAVLYELCCGIAPRTDQPTTTLADFKSSLLSPTPTPAEAYRASADPEGVAALRQTSMRKLRRRLDGDLAWILNTGLAVEPQRRFTNASQLANDLQNWLAGYPIHSRPASAAYRFNRWVGRHKLPLAIAAVGVAGLAVAGSAVVEQTQVAQEQAARATWANQFLLGIFEQADPVLNQRKPITVNELTDQATSRLLDDRSEMSPAARLDASSVLGPIQRNLGQFAAAAQLSELQLGLAREGGKPRLVAEALVAHAESLTSLDKLKPAAELLNESLSLVPLDSNVDLLAVKATQQRALLLARMGEVAQAQQLLAQLFAHEAAIATTVDGPAMMALIYGTLSEVELQSDRGAAGLESAQRALEYARQAGQENRGYADALAGVAAAHFSMGDSQAAAETDRQVVDAFERLYGADHPQSIQAKSELAISLSQLGQMAQAQTIYEAVLSGYRATLGNENQFVAGTLMSMGSAQRALGNFADAADYYEQSLAIWNQLESAPPGSVAGTQAGYARALTELERFDEAERSFTQALNEFEGIIGKDAALFNRVQCFYAGMLIRAGRIEAASKILPTAYQRVHAEYGADSKRTAIAGIPLAELLHAQGDTSRAGQLAERAVTVLGVTGLRDRHALELSRATQLLTTQ